MAKKYIVDLNGLRYLRCGGDGEAFPPQEKRFLERANRPHYKAGLLFIRLFSALFLFTP
jgi:hypothetical protein